VAVAKEKDQSRRSADERDIGARAILRVPEILLELAATGKGHSLSELDAQLDIPKASLHRILRTLERGGYLTHDNGSYRLGSKSFHLARLISQAAPPHPFPACAKPELERLAAETGETVMLGILSDDKSEISYVDVIDSKQAVRFTIAVGDRRPLYCVASGMALLAFMPATTLRAYLKKTRFVRFTARTTDKNELTAKLNVIKASAIAFDDGGRVLGASAAASPIFDAAGTAFCAVSVAGPSERIEAHREKIAALSRKAAERISRVVGYKGSYPPKR
jgi:DNA-binding IclR family transcriptional regulator